MHRYIDSIFLFIFFVCISDYTWKLIDNLINIQGIVPVSYSFLLILFIAAIRFLLAIFANTKLYLSYHSLLIILYCTYITCMATIDIQKGSTLDFLVSNLFSPSSGLLTFFFLGSFVSLVCENIFETGSNWQIRKSFLILAWMLTVVMAILSFLVLKDASANLVGWALIVKKLGNLYQQPTSIYAICFVTYAFVICNLNTSVYSNFGLLAKFNRILLISMFLILSVSSFILLQMLNSNKSALVVLSVSIISLYCIYLCSKPWVRNIIIQYKKLWLNKKFLCQVFLLTFCSLSLLLFLLFNVSGSGLRLLTVDSSGNLASITSRLAILDSYLWTQLSYAPLFGNLEVDKIVGIAGSYPHSLLLYAMSHTGAVGLTFICVILFVSFFQLYKKNPSFMAGSVFSGLPIFVSVSLLAIAGTTIFWSVFWFVLGIYLPIFSVKKSHFSINLEDIRSI